MSETVVLTNGATARIYGTFVDAVAYLTTMFGDQYAEWLDLDADDQKKTLAAAGRFLDRQPWIDAVNTFALRDAVVSADAVKSFQVASYELAALVADDSSILAVADQGSNIEAVNAGGAGVTYFNPQSARQGNTTKLPQILMDLIGQYLGDSAVNGPDGGGGESGSACNPFDFMHGDRRVRPY